MNPTVKLSTLVDDLDQLSDVDDAYLERATGLVVHVFDPMIVGEDLANEGPTADDVESDAFVPLPSLYDVHEWSILRAFCDEIEDEDLRQRLLRAVHGRGAFRYFKDEIYRARIEDDWFAFRDARLADIAREWLESEGVAFIDDLRATTE